MKINRFQEQVRDVKKWEKKLAERLASEYIENRKIQKMGIDAVGPHGKLEFKIRWDDYPDILIETAVGGKPGWFYASKADIVVYCWIAPSRTKFLNTGYLITLDDDFRRWFEHRKPYFEEKRSKSMYRGRIWYTNFFLVPIKVLPKKKVCTFNPNRCH